MFAHVTPLCWWKTDHNETTNEDVFLADTAKGIFVVADGVSTLFFSRLWADILVKHFLETPLMGNDPFEVEWWLRPAQERYREQAPDINTLHWSTRQKGREGSASTLASVRITHIDDAAAVPIVAELLSFGDSCIFIGNENTMQLSFPIENVSDFERAPICVPSLLAKFNRKFHRCLIKRDVPLQTGDIMILATDAVSKWILSKGANTYATVSQAFMAIASKTPDHWRDFITQCRLNRQMVDDDSTALVVRLSSEPNENTTLLGSTPGHSEKVVRQRNEQFQNAVRQQDKEAIAISYGDGGDIDDTSNPLSKDEIAQAREVANALAEVWQALRSSLNSSQFPQKVEQAWRAKASLLEDEPCASKLIETLKASGVSLEASAPAAEEDTIPLNTTVPRVKDSASVNPSPPASTANVASADATKKLIEGMLTIISEACGRDDDNTIVSVYNQLPQEYYTSLATETRKRVQLAVDRQQALQELRIVLRKSTAQEMVKAYDDRPVLHDSQTLHPREKQQLQLARHLVLAEKNNDSGAFISACDAIYTSDYREHFIQSDSEQRRYHKAKQERELLAFRNVLNAPNLQPEQLWQAYRAAEHDIVSQISEEERFKVELAKRFVVAFHSNSETAIAYAYIASLYSFPTLFTFDQPQQVEEATKTYKRPLRPLSSVAVLGEETIDYERFRKAYTIYRLFLFYRSKALEEQQLFRDHAEQTVQELAKLQVQLHMPHLLKETLEALIRDRLILRGIREAKNLGNDLKRFHQDVKTSVNNYFSDFSVDTKRNYEKLLKGYQLSKTDAEELFTVWSRHGCFDKYLRLWGLSPLDEWLHTRNVRVIYPEWAAQEKESTNTRIERSWIFKWQGWNSNTSGDM